jgi:hypothetical protein
MDLRKVKAGDDLKIPAATYNAFIDAAVSSRSSNHRGEKSTPLQAYAADVVLVKNVTGEPLDRYAAVRIDRPLILPTEDEDEFKNRLAFKVTTPTGEEPGRWVVLLEPLTAGGEGDEENGAVGRAVVSGAVVCKIDLISEADEFVETATGSYLPESGASGTAPILWVAGGVGTATATGEQWAVIKLGGGGAALSVGQYTGMVYQNVSDNQMGHQYTRAAPIP